MHQEGTSAGVNVGPGVGDLAGRLEHLGDDLVAGLHEVDQVVVLDVLVSELELAHEARVGLAEDCVTVAWHDLARGEGILHILSNVILGPGLAELGLEVEQELEAFLVSKAVKGSSKTIHTC